MAKKSKAQLEKEIKKLLDRSEELFQRHRNAVDDTAVKTGEFSAIAAESQRLLEELKNVNNADESSQTVSP